MRAAALTSPVLIPADHLRTGSDLFAPLDIDRPARSVPKDEYELKQ
jgi:hypothetical protein